MNKNKDLFFKNNVLIENAISKYYDDESDDNLNTVIESIRQRMHEEGRVFFSVPEDANEDHQSQFNTITDDEGNKWILVFTSTEEFDKCKFGIAKSHSIDWTLRISLKNGFAGLVINPWGQFFMLTREHMEMIFNEDGDLEYYVPTDMVKPDIMQDGAFLKKAISILKRNTTEINLMKICLVLVKSKVWIPCRTDIEDKSAQMNKDINELAPDILLRDNKYYLPAFTSVEEMGDYGDGFSKIEKPLMDVIDFVDKETEISRIEINPFSDPIFIPREKFDYLYVIRISLENGIFNND